MWFFMITCYVMSLVTFIALLVAFAQSFTNFPIFHAGHVTFMIFTCVLYFFTETLVMFFFVGTGVSVKEYTQTHKLGPQFHKRSIDLKRKIYPPQLLNILFMIILFILVGAVDTYRVPRWIYQFIFIGCVVHYIRIKVIEHVCFKQNTELILEMSGVTRGTK